MFREHSLGSDTDRLHLAEGPAHGPPLLLLHGVLRRGRDFFPLFGPLSTRWQLQALDFRGHGSSAPQASYRVVDYLADAGRALESFAEPAVVYGHSLGAMVALAAAARHPDRVAGLILEDPPFETMGSRIRRTAFHSLFVGMRDALAASRSVSDLAGRLAEVRVTHPESDETTRLGEVRDAASLRFSAHCLWTIDPRVLEPIIAGEWLDGYTLEALPGRVGCPTLILQADLDAGGMLTDDDARMLEREIDDALRVPFPGFGHLLHWQALERTLAVVGNFLETLR